MYYVSVLDGKRWGLLAGPFETHAEALALVDAAMNEAFKHDRDACWYAYGTAKVPDEYVKPGVLNAALGLPTSASNLPKEAHQ